MFSKGIYFVFFETFQCNEQKRRILKKCMCKILK